MPLKDTCEKLELLLRSSQALISCETVEEDRFKKLARTAAYNLKIPFFEWSVVEGFKLDGNALQPSTSEPIEALKFIRQYPDQAAFLLNDFVAYLNLPSVIRLFRETVVKVTTLNSSILLCAPEINLAKEVAHLAYPLELKFPTTPELHSLLKVVVEGLMQVRKIRIDLTAEDTKALLSSLAGLTLRQARQVLTYVILEDEALTAKDIQSVLKRKAELVQDTGVLDFYPVSDQALKMGGFAELKTWLGHAQAAYTKEAKALNLPAPKGIMLVGVPGCGKSLSAKMVASEWRQPLLRLDAARLFDKYIGESERNFQKATQIAEAMAPCVFWIDEIEKLLGASTSGSSDSGVGQRLFGAFLTWLQEKKHEVFLVATANDLSQLPPELLRKGRFDEIFFVDLPSQNERGEILAIQLRARNQDPQKFDLQHLAAVTEGFSGAELEQLINAALLKALREKQSLTTAALANESTVQVPLSRSRAIEIEALRRQAQGRFRPVG